MYRREDGESPWRQIVRVLRIALVLPWVRLFDQGLRATLIWAFDRARLLLSGVPTLRFARVTPQLYIGGQFREKGWERLQADGVTAVVNLRREHDDRAAGLPIPPERYLHLPTVDDTPVALEDLVRGADWIAAQIAGGETVYVHCAAGAGRAPSLGAAYLIKHHGMSTDEALATIRQTRPFVRLVGSQEARLREFEAWMRDGRRASP